MAPPIFGCYFPGPHPTSSVSWGRGADAPARAICPLAVLLYWVFVRWLGAGGHSWVIHYHSHVCTVTAFRSQFDFCFKIVNVITERVTTN